MLRHFFLSSAILAGLCGIASAEADHRQFDRLLVSLDPASPQLPSAPPSYVLHTILPHQNAMILTTGNNVLWHNLSTGDTVVIEATKTVENSGMNTFLPVMSEDRKWLAVQSLEAWRGEGEAIKIEMKPYFCLYDMSAEKPKLIRTVEDRWQPFLFTEDYLWIIASPNGNHEDSKFIKMDIESGEISDATPVYIDGIESADFLSAWNPWRSGDHALTILYTHSGGFSTPSVAAVRVEGDSIHFNQYPSLNTMALRNRYAAPSRTGKYWAHVDRSLVPHKIVISSDAEGKNVLQIIDNIEGEVRLGDWSEDDSRLYATVILDEGSEENPPQVAYVPFSIEPSK